MRRRAPTHCTQRGVTLVELLAALVIGLLVIGAAIATMLLSRASAATATDVAQLQQQGSYALRVFGMQARQAGSLDLAKSPARGMVSFNADFKGFGETGAAVQGKEGKEGAPDTVSLSSQPPVVDPDAKAAANAATDSVPRDCLANKIKAVDARLDSTFWVTEGETKGESKGELKCRGINDTQPIVANVVDFQAWYRVVTSTGSIQRMTADEVDAAGLWNVVRAVEICLDLKGTQPTGDQPSSTYIDCQGKTMPRNGVLHMLFRNVFVVRTQGAS